MAKVACAQLDVAFGNLEHNTARAVSTIERLATEAVDLVVFPECFLTGYCVSSLVEAQEIAIPASGIAPIQPVCDRLEIMCVVGFAERDGSTLYNSAALLEPGTAPRFYRKTHLPELGLDKFVGGGDEIRVFDTRIGKLGIFICFDLRPPEVARCLALAGAELLVLPTNWPEGAYAGPQFVAPARASENRCFLATCNRVGEENTFRFIGQSGIYDVGGHTLAKAGAGEEVIVAEFDMAEARNKRNVVRPGEYETTIFQSRRPELYGPIVAPWHDR